MVRPCRGRQCAGPPCSDLLPDMLLLAQHVQRAAPSCCDPTLCLTDLQVAVAACRQLQLWRLLRVSRISSLHCRLPLPLQELHSIAQAAKHSLLLTHPQR